MSEHVEVDEAAPLPELDEQQVRDALRQFISFSASAEVTPAPKDEDR